MLKKLCFSHRLYQKFDEDERLQLFFIFSKKLDYVMVFDFVKLIFRHDLKHNFQQLILSLIQMTQFVKCYFAHC